MMSKLQEVRTTRGMTQLELSEMANISRTGLSLIETGAAEPRIETLKKIARALDVPWQNLIED